MLVPPGNRLSQSGTKLTKLALEAAGVPTLTLDADMVNASDWSHERMVEHVGQFLTARGTHMKLYADGCRGAACAAEHRDAPLPCCTPHRMPQSPVQPRRSGLDRMGAKAVGRTTCRFGLSGRGACCLLINP